MKRHLMVLYEVGPRVQDGLAPGGPGFNHRNTYKNIKNLLQTHLAQMLEIWYVALPSGPVPIFVQMKVPGSKMAPRQGVLGSNHRNI